MRMVIASVIAVGLIAVPAADAKTLKVNWQEYKTFHVGQINFHVTKIVVTSTSWSVTASVTNKSPLTFGISRPPTIPAGPLKGFWDFKNAGFGLGVYTAPKGGGFGGFPARLSNNTSPALPSKLGPNESWRGTFSGKAKIPTKTELRLTFGLFTIRDAPAESQTEVGKSFSWLTDHSFRL